MTRRISATIGAIAVSVLVLALIASALHQAARNLALPLGDTGIIREQAAEKRLDPALIAAVIYAETKFDPRPSPAGAQGLMQILPATAYYLAHLSGGRTFTAADLASPSVNVAYGSYYLRYLLDRFGGDEMLAVAAYNGGLTNVEQWVAQASAAGSKLTVATIPFPETREYVQRVLAAQRAYRATYPRQLGIS
jgi:soluble lytic murein transglycosylase